MHDGDLRGHIQDVAQGGASAADGAFAEVFSGVAVEGRHADQGGELAAVGLAEFVELGDEGRGKDRPDAGDRAEARVEVFHVVIGVDEGGDLLVEAFDLLIQDVQDGIEGFSGGLGGGGLEAVGLVDLGGDELFSAGDQSVEFRLFFGAFDGQTGFGEACEFHEDQGVEGIGFGQDAQGLGEVADFAGVDPGDGQPDVEQGLEKGLFQTAGGL